MPGGELVPLQSADLAICWVLDSARLGLPPSFVETGPNFMSFGISIEDWQYGAQTPCFRNNTNVSEVVDHKLRYTTGGWNPKGMETIWDHFSYNDSVTKSSANFRNIYAYALSAQSLQIIFNGTSWVSSAAAATLSPPSADTTTTITTTTTGVTSVDWRYNQSMCIARPPGLPNSLIETPGYIGPGESQASILPLKQSVDYSPFNESGFEETRLYRYAINNSIPRGKPGMIPYNSTLWLNNTAFKLPAPFLDIGLNCSGNRLWNSLGNCICYKGKPILPDLLDTQNAICTTAPGLRWGFSTNLVRLGLILEAVWLFCYLLTYLCLFGRSKLLSLEPIRTAGSMRSVLECSRSILDDLGSDATNYSEQDLLQKLKGKRVTYRVHEESTLGRDANLSQLRCAGDHEAERIRMRSLQETLRTSDALNIRFYEGVRWIMKSIKAIIGADKVAPSDLEVYEDLNWRIYR
ncbi:hypothetical protein HD806DRAFT_541843 [Xylariaceae sp. AK1471]|nr:hypothetical protein HD806DRAFT_541843 [Xylariaceae sp. AK1471]